MSIRRVFFGCNYNDQSIKKQFDKLKVRLEKKFPIDCVVIDKRRNKPAQDIWNDIRGELAECEALFFDVTAFRPNVVLELGYALAVWEDDPNVFITWRRRRTGGAAPAWLLSDVSHLQRFEYTTVAKLDEFVEGQLLAMPWLQRFSDFNNRCETSLTAADKYRNEGLRVLQKLRDDGPQTVNQIQQLIQGSAVRRETLTNWLVAAQLAKRSRGRYSRFMLRED
jgi:hypothetical protein